MDWKTLGNYVLLVGLFVAMVTMFNQVNGRLDTIQAENQRQHDAMNGRIDTLQADMNRRFDTMQAENQRQHDVMQEVLRVFEGRITRLEEKPALTPTTPNSGFLAPACWGRPERLHLAPLRVRSTKCRKFPHHHPTQDLTAALSGRARPTVLR